MRAGTWERGGRSPCIVPGCHGRRLGGTVMGEDQGAKRRVSSRIGPALGRGKTRGGRRGRTARQGFAQDSPGAQRRVAVPTNARRVSVGTVPRAWKKVGWFGGASTLPPQPARPRTSCERPDRGETPVRSPIAHRCCAGLPCSRPDRGRTMCRREGSLRSGRSG